MSVPIAPPPGRGSRVWRLALRVVFTLIPLVSLGILAWVPLLRLALLRRRIVDWALFTLTLVLSTAATFTLDHYDGKPDWHDTAAGLVLLMVAFGAAAYFPIADRGIRPGEAALPAGDNAVPQFPGYPPAYPAPAAYRPLVAAPVPPPPAAAGPAPRPVPPPPPQPPERIRKVRDELGEISDYLRKKDGW